MKIEINKKQALILRYILNNVQNQVSSKALSNEGFLSFMQDKDVYTEHLDKWLKETGAEFLLIQDIKEQLETFLIGEPILEKTKANAKGTEL